MNLLPIRKKFTHSGLLRANPDPVTLASSKAFEVQIRSFIVILLIAIQGFASQLILDSVGVITDPAWRESGFRVLPAASFTGDELSDFFYLARKPDSTLWTIFLRKGSIASWDSSGQPVLTTRMPGSVSVLRSNADDKDDLTAGFHWRKDSGYSVIRIYHGGKTFPAEPGREIVNLTSDFLDWGKWVFSTGDLDGNGYGDVAVWCRDAFHPTRAQILIYLLNNQQDRYNRFNLKLVGPDTLYGRTATSAGDANNDGFDDFVVCSPFERTAYVLFGQRDLDTTSSPNVRSLKSTLQGFAASIVAPGDLNGDSLPDLVIGAPEETASSKRAIVYWGNPSQPFLKSASFDPETAEQDFGRFCFPVGDLNEDGRADLACGLPATRRIRIFFGTSGTVPLQQKDSIHYTSSDSLFGNQVAWLKDPTGDGYPRIVISSPSGAGKLQLFRILKTSSQPLIPTPKQFMSVNNWPNPFNPSTMIQLRLSQNLEIHSIRVFDLQGALVDVLSGPRNLTKGRFFWTWDPSKTLSSGVYLIQIRSPGNSLMHKVTLIK